MPEEKMIICVGCPLGCEITLTLNDNGEVSKVQGNSCREGKAYALEEYLNPVRILTATVRTGNSSRPLLPVKTDKPILKTQLKQGMFALAKIKVNHTLKIGEVIIKNFLDTGVDVVAADNLPLIND